MELKERFFKETLGELADGILEPIVASPDIWFYRNKMEFAFGHENGRLSLGLHPKGSIWSITNLKTCDIFSPEVETLLNAIRVWALRRGHDAFHSKRGTGQLRHLVIREGKNTGQRMINLVSTSELESVEGFIEVLKSLDVRIDAVLWSRNDGVADVAQGEASTVLFGEGMIEERIGDLEWRVTRYVSCNPKSLAQDLRALSSVYAVERIVPMDFYPHTPHLESMTLLRPRNL